MNFKSLSRKIATTCLLLISFVHLLVAQDESSTNLPNFNLSIWLPVILFVMFFFFVSWFLISRYRRCPSDKILVVYGKTDGGTAKPYHGGGAFVWPVIQDYKYMDLNPMSIDVDLSDALSKQNIRVTVPSQFTIAIGTTADLMKTAAERLLSLTNGQISQQARDIILGQLRQVIASLDIEELNSNREKFVQLVFQQVGTELHKLGLDLINVNIKDIHDSKGYIDALGKEAAAKAINDANAKVANEDKTGAINVANHNKEMRISTSESEAQAVIGEKQASARSQIGINTAELEIEASNTEKRKKLSELHKDASITEQKNAAVAEKEGFDAKKIAQDAKFELELSTKRAEEIVDEEIDKERIGIQAQKEADQQVTLATGKANAYKQETDALVERIEKSFEANSTGFKKLVDAAGGDAKSAIGFLMVDKLEDLAKIQADAIKNIKFDKVTVFDGGNGNGGGTAGFVQNLFKMVPPLQEYLNQNGMKLPEYLAETVEAVETKVLPESSKTADKDAEK
jgi:flotillin